MSTGKFGTVHVHLDHDTNTWLLFTEDGLRRTLAAVSRLTAQTEAEAVILSVLGAVVIPPWVYAGDDEAGSQALYGEPGSSVRTKAALLAMWNAHKTVLVKLGLDPAVLTAAQRALLFSQDVMLIGIVKILIDKELITEDDIRRAGSVVGAADFSGITP